MAKENDILFELLQVLTPQEKKYITASVQKGAQGYPTYFLLFQWMGKLESSNDKWLKNKLKKINKEKQLPYLKNYLYHYILDKLFVLESDLSVEAKVNKLLVKANLLFEKSLLIQADAILDKAFDLAKNVEDYGLLIRINRLQMNVKRKLILGSELIKQGSESYREGRTFIDQLANEWDYEEVNFQLVNRFMYINRARNEAEEKEYDSLLQNPLVLNEKEALSSRSHRLFHNIHGTKSLYERDFDNFYFHSKQIVKSYHNQEALIANELQKYIGALYNYAKSLVNVKKFKEVDEVLERIQNLNTAYPKQAGKPKIEVLIYELSILIIVNLGLNSNDMEMMYDRIIPYKEQFIGFQPRIRKITQLYLVRSFSFIHFVKGEFEEALKWDVLFLEEFAEHEKSRMYLITKLSYLIVHYELQNFDYLPYILRSTYRYLKKRNSPLKFEKRIIKFLKVALSTVEKQDIKELFEELRTDLIELAKDPKENVVNDFVYVEWLEHKILGKNLIEVIQAKGVN